MEVIKPNLNRKGYIQNQSNESENNENEKV